MINCILTGVGGQGIVLASKLLGQSAIDKGMMVRTSETIGMAQRGGCVVSHVRIGDKIGDTCHSPLIPLNMADVVMGFEPAEAVRYFPYLKEGGTVIINKNPVKPVTDSLSKTDYDVKQMIDYLKSKVENLILIDGDTIARECGSYKVLNMVLLGSAAASGALGISTHDLKKTINKKFSGKFLNLNLQAISAGEKAVLKGENK